MGGLQSRRLVYIRRRPCLTDLRLSSAPGHGCTDDVFSELLVRREFPDVGASSERRVRAWQSHRAPLLCRRHGLRKLRRQHRGGIRPVHEPHRANVWSEQRVDHCLAVWRHGIRCCGGDSLLLESRRPGRADRSERQFRSVQSAVLWGVSGRYREQIQLRHRLGPLGRQLADLHVPLARRRWRLRSGERRGRARERGPYQVHGRHLGRQHGECRRLLGGPKSRLGRDDDAIGR